MLKLNNSASGKLVVLMGFLFLASGFDVSAQEKEVFNKKGLQLTFVNQDPGFSTAVKTRMVNTFFTVYPVLMKNFNSKASREVTFVIDTGYKGVAATANRRVSYSPAWFRQHPGDIDVVTHEVMHIVQDYGEGGGPWWITEGIADYVRYIYGVDNAGANWKLPDFKDGQKYDNGYRITARFFAWLEKHGYKGIVKTLDSNMRAHTYTDQLWKKETTKSLDELWAAYARNPVI